MDDLRRQYMELLRAYRDNQTPLEGADQENPSSSQRAAEVARETFKASFGARLEQTPAVLSSMPFDQAVELMVEWSSQRLPMLGRGNDTTDRRESFTSVEECSERLKELTSDSEENSRNETSRACPWPFIRKIRYVVVLAICQAFLLRKLSFDNQRASSFFLIT